MRCTDRGFEQAPLLWVGQGLRRPSWVPDPRSADVELLLGNSTPELPDGRVPLYTCPQCGDLGCGAVTVALVAGPDFVSWSDWGFQSNGAQEKYLVDRENLDDLRTFTFARPAYEETLRSALTNARAL